MFNRRKMTAQGRLLAADTTRALIAAPGVGFRLRIFRVFASVATVAAQAIDVGVDGGGVGQQVLSIAASATIPHHFWCEEGFPLPENTAFSAKPAAAGPAVQFFVEYIIEKL